MSTCNLVFVKTGLSRASFHVCEGGVPGCLRARRDAGYTGNHCREEHAFAKHHLRSRSEPGRADSRLAAGEGGVGRRPTAAALLTNHQ